MFFPLPMAPPAEPTQVLAFQDSTTSLLLAWVSGGGTTSGFRLSYQSGSTAPADCSSGTVVTQATIGSATNYTVTGLTSNTNYSFRVCAVNANSDMSSGLTVTLATPIGTPIYRSVGPSATANIGTGGANALTISGSVATFGSALADKVGVGDTIQYDTDANGTEDKIVFIHGRISSTQYLVKTNAGAAPTAVASTQTWKVFRAYIQLVNATLGTENTGILLALRNFDSWANGRNLVTNGEAWYIACYADAADTGNVEVRTNWVTSSNYWLTIYTPYEATQVGTSQRHAGVWTTSGYNLTGSAVDGSDVVNIASAWVRVTGLQLKMTDNTNWATVLGYGETSSAAPPSNSEAEFSNNIVWHAHTNTARWFQGIAMYHATDTTSKLYVINNIVYSTNGTRLYAIVADTGGMYAYNNTVSGVYVGISKAFASADLTAKNNIAQSCVGSCYDVGGLGWGAGSNYNVSSDTTKTSGANDKISTTVSFVNAASKDFHLAPGDTAAKDAGTDLSNDAVIKVLFDIDAESRTGTWDIGADSL